MAGSLGRQTLKASCADTVVIACPPMCVTKLSSTSGRSTAERQASRPVQSKTHGWYRVLRAASPRGGPRSVDRDCAGRNAIGGGMGMVGVKGLSPDNPTVGWWPSRYQRDQNTGRAKAALVAKASTTGVRDHGMYRRPTTERERSAESRVEGKRPWPRGVRQGGNAESASILSAEVRCPHSSDEAGQLRWSEGGHGE
jgi:hypothetical protein